APEPVERLAMDRVQSFCPCETERRGIQVGVVLRVLEVDDRRRQPRDERERREGGRGRRPRSSRGKPARDQGGDGDENHLARPEPPPGLIGAKADEVQQTKRDEYQQSGRRERRPPESNGDRGAAERRFLL